MSSGSPKPALRQKMHAIRENLDSEACKQAGAQILGVFEKLPEFRDFRAFALFASTAGEPDTRPLFERIVGSGRQAFLPRCLDDGGLEFVRVEDWSVLEKGRFGILEPAESLAPAAASSIDLFLVPGLAFDRRGARLGRGGGYYDRSLPPGCLAWGLAFESQWVKLVPNEAHDRLLDGVLTEAGLTRADRPA
ncbi:5-formyltetrahydrofolate cyclo-ligase [Myxococcota bacterium]|nr:5-formyltetrahydrofolate cyclo-ligase [Myxococcota bacterium]